MKAKFWNIVSVVLAAALCIGVSTVFRACGAKEDGTWMHCHDVQRTVLVLGLAAAAAGLAGLSGRRAVPMAAAAAGAVISLITALLPGRIMPMCMMETMRCQAVMKPFVTVVCVVAVLVFAAGLAAAIREKR